MIGTFQMLRTDVNHIGSASLTSLTGSVVNNTNSLSTETGKATQNTFENYLLDAVNYVNGKQQSSDELAQQLIIDPDSVDVHDVTIAMAEANLSLSIAQTVIDRVVTAWNEITTTR